MSDDIVKRLCVEITEEDFDRREIIDGVACWGHLHRRLRERINKDRADAANEILRLRAELADERENARNKLMDAAYWQERAEAAEAVCDELRALFREEKVLNPTNFYAADRLRARIDALLNKGGGDE